MEENTNDKKHCASGGYFRTAVLIILAFVISASAPIIMNYTLADRGASPAETESKLEVNTDETGTSNLDGLDESKSNDGIETELSKETESFSGDLPSMEEAGEIILETETESAKEPASETEPSVEFEPDTELESEPELETEVEVDSETEPEPETEEPETEAESESDIESEVSGEDEPVESFESESETEFDIWADNPGFETETESEPETETVPEDYETESETEFDIWADAYDPSAEN